MAIKGNVDLTKAVEIINRRYNGGITCFLGDTVVIHPNEEPINHLLLTRHAMNVRVNEKVAVGSAFFEVMPEWLVPAVIDWDAERYKK